MNPTIWARDPEVQRLIRRHNRRVRCHHRAERRHGYEERAIMAERTRTIVNRRCAVVEDSIDAHYRALVYRVERGPR